MTIIGIDISKAKPDCAWLRDENKAKIRHSAPLLPGITILSEHNARQAG